MALVDDITQLRQNALASLNASHNYYTHTKVAWRLVQQMIRQGRNVTVRNQLTGTTTDGNELAALAQPYISGYLSSATFQDFVALFERFVFDFFTAWLSAYPGSLAGSQLKFRTVLDASDKDQIVSAVVRKELQDLAYQRVADWFSYLEKIAQLGCPSPDQIERLSEIKASRDVLVHNSGIAIAIYVDKSKTKARFAAGDPIDLPEHYHRASWQLITQVVSELATAAIDKLNG